jgi:hypothetical protein
MFQLGFPIHLVAGGGQRVVLPGAQCDLPLFRPVAGI